MPKQRRLALAAFTVLALAGSALAGGIAGGGDRHRRADHHRRARQWRRGIRFRFPVFESLVVGLTRADKLADIRPGLAESWEQDKNDKTKWILAAPRRQIP